MKKSNVILATIVLIAILIGGVVAISLYLPYRNQQLQELAREQQTAVAVYENISYHNKMLGAVNLSRMDATTIANILQKEVKPYQDSIATLQVNRDTLTYSMKDLGQRIYYKCSDGSTFESGEENKLAEYIVSIDKDLPIEDQYAIVEGEAEPTTLRISIECDCQEKELTAVIRALSKKYDKSATNSRINTSYQITPSKPGEVLDTETIASELRTYLNRQTTKNFSGAYQTSKVSPVWKEDDLRKVNTLIARYTTNFKNSTARGYNIRLAATRLNGICLLPGESISFLDTLYDKSDKKSYKKSGAYLNGEVVQAEGGGICQVSTTAYHTFLLAGITPEKRYPHSMPVGYAKLGLDAALSVGGKDLVIKNTLDVPILILSQAKSGTLAVAIQSYKDALKGYTYKPRAEKVSDLEANAYLDVYKGKNKERTIALSHDVYQAR